MYRPPTLETPLPSGEDFVVLWAPVHWPRTEEYCSGFRLASARSTNAPGPPRALLRTRHRTSFELAERGVDAYFFPVDDFHAFEPKDLRLLLDVLTGCLDDDQTVMVHCWAGQGRTGTVAACALIDRGSSPEDALADVRRARPGAVENAPQIELVNSWANRVW